MTKDWTSDDWQAAFVLAVVLSFFIFMMGQLDNDPKCLRAIDDCSSRPGFADGM